MGIVAGAIWMFNFLAVFGGYLALVVYISMCVLAQMGKTQLLRLSVLTCALSLPLAWLSLHELLSSMPVKRLHVFSAFTEITWRPFMLWLALASVGCCAVALHFRGKKPVFLLLIGASAVLAYAGLVQAIAGFFFANDIFRAYGFELLY